MALAKLEIIMGTQKKNKQIALQDFSREKVIAPIFTPQCGLLTWKDQYGLTCV